MFGLTGQTELVELATANGKVKAIMAGQSQTSSENWRACSSAKQNSTIFSHHISPNFCALANQSGRTEWLWSISKSILARTSSENSCVPFKNWLIGPARLTRQMESAFKSSLTLCSETMHFIFTRCCTCISSYTEYKSIH